jgi:hypothetical protein
MGMMDKAKEVEKGKGEETPSAHEPKKQKHEHPSAEKGKGKETKSAHEPKKSDREGKGKETPAAHEPDAEVAASQAPDNSVQSDTDDDSSGGDVQPASDSGGDDSEDASSASPDAEGPEDQDSGEGADAGGQQAQGDGQPSGGAQGPTPVPNPAAPGAGDDTSGGQDTPAPGAGPETSGEDNQAGPGANADLPQVPMSPGLQDEYERANALLMKTLYSMPGDAASKAVLGAIEPDGPMKIRGVVHISLMMLTQIHKQMQDMPPQLVLPVLKDVVAHVMDLGEQVKQVQYSDQEGTAILGAAYEGAMRIFGVSKGNVKNLAHHVGKKTLVAHAKKHQEALNFAKPAMDATKNSGGQQDAGAPNAAGPQSGAPAGSEATPQAGAPPQQPPAQGGMLQQAADASPAAQGEEA